MTYFNLIKRYKKRKLSRAKEEPVNTELVKLVNQSIHKAFIKMGIAVAVITVMVTLFVIFIVPKMVSSYYYDPGNIVEGETNQMSLDLAVYSELGVPGAYRTYVTSESNGYGSYDIMIPQLITTTNMFTNVAGKIQRGKLTLYDPNVLRKPTRNAFGWSQTSGNINERLTDLHSKELDNSVHGAAGNVEDATATLKGLHKDIMYVGYVTLNQRMKYEDFYQYINKKVVDDCDATWCAITTEPVSKEIMFSPENLGVGLSQQRSNFLDWDQDAYPQLILGDKRTYEEDRREKELEKNKSKEAFMKKHFLQMLEYMSKQKSFLKMMDESPDLFESAADYIRENGLIVYGYTVIGEKEALLKLNAQEEVYQIYAQPLK